jgi:hypothetical protein
MDIAANNIITDDINNSHTLDTSVDKILPNCDEAQDTTLQNEKGHGYLVPPSSLLFQYHYY